MNNNKSVNSYENKEETYKNDKIKNKSIKDGEYSF